MVNEVYGKMKKNINSGDKLFMFLVYLFLTVWLLVILYPLIYIVSASFSSPNAVLSGRVWLLPVEPTLMGYKAAFSSRDIFTGYINSIYYVLAGTALNVVMTVIAAYPLSRKDFAGKNIIMGLFTVTMFFNGGMIPFYMVVKSLNMIDTRWAIIVPTAMTVFNVIIARTYFQSNIPDELLEASQLDGCNDFRFVWSVVLPLSAPIIAVLVLFYAVANWNAYFNALLFLSSKELFPLQIVVRNILLLNQNTNIPLIGSAESAIAQKQLKYILKYSLLVIASGPVLIMYPFAQKYFIKGVMIGALKA